MQPTFERDSYIIMRHWWQPPRHLQRGTIVIFQNPYDHHSLWMKRIIGIAGDHLRFQHHRLYINGILCNPQQRHFEQLPLQQGHFTTPYRIWASYLEHDWSTTVPPEHVFLMGDNRGDSIDSRQWGSIHIKYLVGKPWVRF